MGTSPNRMVIHSLHLGTLMVQRGNNGFIKYLNSINLVAMALINQYEIFLKKDCIIRIILFILLLYNKYFEYAFKPMFIKSNSEFELLKKYSLHR